MKRPLPWLLLSALLAAPAGPGPVPLTAQAQIETLVCPMHPDVRRTSQEPCPKCGMTLVPFKASTTDAYELDLKASGPLKAGKPVTFTMRVLDPVTGERVTDWVEVHEKLAHTFVISSDMTVFEHVHPVVGKDGTLTLPWTPPAPGRYHVFLDVVPAGGLPQFLEAVLLTEDAPAVDKVPTVWPGNEAEADGVHATLYPEGVKELVAGDLVELRLRFKDAKTGAAISNEWKTWLGAWAHLVALREDVTEPVHGHPEEALVTRSATESSVHIDAIFPRPGHYRIWVQLQRGTKVVTLPFSVDVKDWATP